MSHKLKMKKSEKQEITQALSMLSQIGITMVIIIGGCVLLGKFLDDKLHTAPLMLFVFVLLGVGAAFYNLYDTTIKGIEKKHSTKPRRKSD